MKKTENYILYVGTLQPRKNVQTLIKAFEKFQRANQDFKLKIVGKKGWLFKDIFSLVEELKLEDKVIFTGFLPDKEVNELYKRTFCFVYPSLYDGFGIPLLEAMAQNCPVISSNASSLPEVGADACLYFDPKDDVQLFKHLNILKNDQRLRNALIKKGKERVKLFSWSKCAEETLEVIKNVIK